MRKCLLYLLTFIWLITLTSCGLMPQEDVLPASPIIYSYEAETYEMASVMRGDMELSTIVSCTYVPAKAETLSFSLGSIYIDKVYVSEGDQVKPGQILAELAQENLQEQKAALSHQLKVLELKKIHTLENLELDLKKYDIILADLNWELDRTEGVGEDVLLKKKEEQEKMRAEVEAEYADLIRDAEDAVYLQKLQLEEVQENLKKRQLISGIGGTVTYVSSVSEGQRSVKGEKFVTVSDLDTTVFIVKGKDAQYFTVGMEVMISCQDKEIPAYVAEASEFGLSEKEDEEPVAYLKLKQPDPALKDGVRGKVNIILEQRENTLYVNKDAVKITNGEAFVYMLDEDGIRIMQKVTTGLESGKFIEIIDGLKENDSVIID